MVVNLGFKLFGGMVMLPMLNTELLILRKHTHEGMECCDGFIVSEGSSGSD